MSGPRVAATARRALRAAFAALTMTSAIEVECEAARLLQDVIRCDQLLHTEIRLQDAATVRVGPDLRRERGYESALSHVGHLHPAVLSYLMEGDLGEPRRVSDVLGPRAWMIHPTYTEAFRGRGGLCQLSLVTSLNGAAGSGWVLLRDAIDFSDADVEAATLLLPQLVGLAELARVKDACPGVGSLQHDGDVSRAITTAAHNDVLDALTSRERVVLENLGTGASARQIARALGISEATTRKHLQHIYAKLGVHDRLEAVVGIAEL